MDKLGIQQYQLGQARICIADDERGVADCAAAHFMEALQAKPDLVWCCASGDSPTLTYRNLATRAAADPALFTRMRVVKLDEWSPMPMDDPRSCEAYVQREVIQPMGVTPERYLTFNGEAPDPEAECARVQSAFEQWGGLDQAVLGLGINGHIGLNEPANRMQDHAHVATLAPETQTHGMLTGPQPKPTRGMTLGMRDLMQSSSLLLLVQGKKKRGPLSRLFLREVTPQFPASMLLDHPNLTIICDEAAFDKNANTNLSTPSTKSTTSTKKESPQC